MNNDINKSSILAPLPMGEGLGERLRADFPILSREVYGKPLVYLDNGATTQKPRQVVNAITDEYYSVNANVHRGVHFLSQQATELHEASRETVRRFINARSTNEIVFTRGTTESINLLVSSFGEEFMQEGDEVILSVMEHHSNIVPWQLLAAKRGITIKVIPMNDKGELLLDEYRQLFSERTRIVSVAHVSNVLGTVNPVKEMIAFAHEQGVPVLVDGAQSIPHMPVDVQDLDADFFVFSAHKVYGPKGIGALYVRRKPRVRIEPQIHGGGHERGMRSGTLATHQIVGMGEAYRLALLEADKDREHAEKLSKRLLDGILKNIPEVYVNGDLKHRVPTNLNISFAYIEGESLMMALKDIAVSSGSACTSASLEPSYVLRAIGRNDELAHSSIRFTLGRFTTEEDIDFTVKLLTEKVAKLRELSPLWEMHKEGIDLAEVKWSAH